MESLLVPPKQFWMLVLAVMLAFGTYLWLPDSCPEAGKRAAAIAVLAAAFWAMDILPQYATSLMVVLLLVFLLGSDGGVLGFDKKGYTTFLIPFSSPVIILFFGGFMLAKALGKYHVDIYITENLLVLFGNKPSRVMLGVMLTTGFLSMWISNTASTAIMLGIAESLISQIDREDPIRKAFFLGIPFAANLGGVGTPIGTPPNIIALGNLEKFAEAPTFDEWMLICFPLAIFLVLVSYFMLRIIFPLKDQALRFSPPDFQPLSRKGKLVFTIFVFTVLMWLTTHFHGIPESVTGLLGVGLMIASGLVDKNDINSINWDVLILMWGGLALSVGLNISGFTQWVVSLPLFQTSGLVLVTVFCVVAFIFSTFISNTATAALMIPIAVNIPGENPIFLAVTMALACSFAMAFPISTPPNAMAYAKGYITTRDMLKAGLPISIISLLVMLLGFRHVIGFILGIEF